MTLLKINRLLPIYISSVLLKFEVDIQSRSKIRVRKTKNSNMAARRPFCKWHRWKSIGFWLWPSSTCIWNLKLKFQSKLDLCSENHVVYRQTDGQTDGRTDGQVESSNPPLQLRWAGYNDMRSNFPLKISELLTYTTFSMSFLEHVIFDSSLIDVYSRGLISWFS